MTKKWSCILVGFVFVSQACAGADPSALFQGQSADAGAESGKSNDPTRRDDGGGTPLSPGGLDAQNRLSVYDDATCFILDSGELKCWGVNRKRLGPQWPSNNTVVGETVAEMGAALLPVPLEGNAVSTCISNNHACAARDDGVVRCWGSEGFVVGGAAASSGAIVDVPLPDTFKAVSVACGYQHSCAMTADGKVACWGKNDEGQLGTGDKSTRNPPNWSATDLWTVNLGTDRVAKSVSAYGSSSCALLDNASVKCWGKVGAIGARGDTTGEMGDAMPTIGIGDTQTQSLISCSATVLSDGTVKRWDLLAGNLGAVTVPMGEGMKALYVSSSGSDGHHCAVLEGGALKCFGANSYGQLGVGDITMRSNAAAWGDKLPKVDLGTAEKVLAAKTGMARTCAYLASGKVKCWGANQQGQLGLGDTKTRGDQVGEMGDALPAVSIQ